MYFKRPDITYTYIEWKQKKEKKSSKRSKHTYIEWMSSHQRGCSLFFKTIGNFAFVTFIVTLIIKQTKLLGQKCQGGEENWNNLNSQKICKNHLTGNFNEMQICKSKSS